jgi:hypothetical protein
VHGLVEGKGVVLHICLRDNLDSFIFNGRSLPQVKWFANLVLGGRPIIYCARELYLL